MLTYTWKVTGLKRKDSDNVKNIIFQTYWEVVGTDEDGNSGSFSGAVPLEVSNVDPNNFINYEDLTEEMVIDWIKSKIQPHLYDLIERKIKEQIDEKVNPATEDTQEFPWGTVSTTIIDPPSPSNT